MSSGPIVVINPNSNEAVTSGLDDALAAFRFASGPGIECLTLAEGPFGIESQLHSDQVVVPLVRLVERRPDASAFVIACYSDPGIDACRSIAKVPVFGIQESGMLTALARGDRVGIIAIAEASVARHRRYMRRMGLGDRVVTELPLNMSVDETARGNRTFERLVEVGGQLVGRGADAIVLGCAGMARHRQPLEDKLGVPVIDPTQAAVAMAMGVVLSAG
ncbi:MAG TPA: aspartate/glutamate racemase family protein [Thermohalobaculum sp.]|nr:aspartate/glutamate racemase family protein [Thermohalobaculum sp.]